MTPLPRALTEPIRLAGLPWRYTYLLGLFCFLAVLVGRFRLVTVVPVLLFLALHPLLRSITARDGLALQLALAAPPPVLLAVPQKLRGSAPALALPLSVPEP